MRGLTVVARIKPGQEEALERILTSIDRSQQENPYVRLAEDRRTHGQRWAIIYDPDNGHRLLLAIEYDGKLDSYIQNMVELSPGLDAIWGKCEGYPGRAGFASFVHENCYPSQAFYIGFRDETVESIRNKMLVRQRLEEWLDHASPQVELLSEAIARSTSSRSWRKALSARLAATRDAFHQWWVGIVLRILRPLSQLGETSNFSKVTSGRSESESERGRSLKKLAGQMITLTEVKPRRYLRLRVALAVTEFLGRSGWAPGMFANVGTLHSFRWVLIDGGKRLFFLSVFDGSWQNYMGDFMDKIIWALDGVYNNVRDYPLGGMKEIEPFKKFVLDHQFEPQLFYSAYPSETVMHLIRDRQINTTLAEGLGVDSDAARRLLEIL